MVGVRIEVKSGGGDFRVMVRARSIQRAVELVERRFPGGQKRVVFPLSSESFFASRGPEAVYLPVSEQVVA